MNFTNQDSLRSAVVEFCQVPDCDGLHIPNLPLLRKIYDEIRTNPEHWNQGTWALRTIETVYGRNELGQFQGRQVVACSSAYCVAGWAAQMSGYTIDWVDAEPNGTDSTERVAELDTNGHPSTTQVEEMGTDGSRMTISMVAQHELGLTDREASDLFNGGNRMYHIRYTCEQIAKRAGEKFE